jgi:hypothetical protein
MSTVIIVKGNTPADSTLQSLASGDEITLRATGLEAGEKVILLMKDSEGEEFQIYYGKKPAQLMHDDNMLTVRGPLDFYIRRSLTRSRVEISKD